MQRNSEVSPYHLVVENETDVIVARQEVRQIARKLGMSLSQQAKIMAAVSTTARSLLTGQRGVAFTIQTTQQKPSPVLEIFFDWIGSYTDTSQLEALFHLDETRFLVNELSISPIPNGAQITLRMWRS